jgi:hypothetical protein
MDDRQGAELTKKRKEPLSAQQDVQAEARDLGGEASDAEAAPKKSRLQVEEEAEDLAPTKGKVRPLKISNDFFPER